MRLRPTLAILTAGAVAGALLLAPAPAFANSATFTNPLTPLDTGAFHALTVDINYTPTNAIVTFHTQGFVGPGYDVELYLSDGAFTDSTGKIVLVDATTDTGPATDTPGISTSTAGFENTGAEVPAPDVSVTHDAVAQTITATVPSSRIFWTGGLFAGAFLSDGPDNASAYAFQTLGNNGATGFGPVLSQPAPTTTTVAVTSPSQVYGSTPAAVNVTVSPANTGTVTLVEGSTPLVASSVTSAGGAVLVLPTSLASGVHTFTVTFTPTNPQSVAASASVPFAVTVISSAKSTKTTVALSKKSQVYKKKATAKLKISVSHAPAGKVAIYDGKKKIKTVTLKKGKASYTLSKTLKKGTHKIKVIYTPTNKELFKASTSKTVKLVVKKK